MHIPDHLIPSLHESCRPVIIYRNEDGSFASGFVLRENEFVANLNMIRAAIESAGLTSLDAEN